ncbi:2-C-methyl-D-erythritol 4-phosphate cytidylyltransferase [Nocardioides bruguierae]|uniref:2-C-methyl-D-erythritol 4-phosphate cytidylyltransferase n=1 Tax=Nocardioides bruguierae TaxID=2945102 RepID=UPI00202285D1|nr:2-C-methyl-D-erythritol 4-phosphate cytidylyltransferase [Nocardioides bruguierae]MCL8024113.1 2-C-methyl-D-erythritol 4-phosphate cytidylyltransferase [Nocardioides bruguierae]
MDERDDDVRFDLSFDVDADPGTDDGTAEPPDEGPEDVDALEDPYADLPDPDGADDEPDEGDEDEEWVEPPEALAVLLTDHRGSLPFSLLHGEALVACAAWALGESGALQVDEGTAWQALVDAEETVVLHDVLCPMTPPSFLVECVRHSQAHGAVVVGVRAVTDTVKEVDEAGVLGETVDRDRLLAVASPVVLPPSVVAALDDGLPTDDLAALVPLLAARWPVLTLAAPPQARRVADADDVAVLEALTRGER